MIYTYYYVRGYVDAYFADFINYQYLVRYNSS